jgi:hypothetical protein
MCDSEIKFGQCYYSDISEFIDNLIRYFISLSPKAFIPFIPVMADLIRHPPIELGIAGLRPQ